MDVLAAIDGTWSHGDVVWEHLPLGIARPLVDVPGGNATNSNTYDFYRRFDTMGGWKDYFEGPDLTGWNVGRIAREVLFYVKREIIKRGDPRIVLVGWSRGAHIAIEVARLLSGFKRVHFLGLYDAVDRTIEWKHPFCSTRPIENVRYVYHAVRSLHRLNNLYMGHAGTTKAPDVDLYLEMREFFASHGAIGGLRPVNGKTLLDRLDSVEGEKAHQWILEGARRRGLRIH